MSQIKHHSSHPVDRHASPLVMPWLDQKASRSINTFNIKPIHKTPCTGSPQAHSLRRIIRFVCIGALAALVHYMVAIVCYTVLGYGEYASNLMGFLTAFAVSYLGQSMWTFAGHTASTHRALPRYFSTASLAFLVNAGVLYVGLYVHLIYPVALLLAIGAAAVFSYVINSLWVFKHD